VHHDVGRRDLIEQLEPFATGWFGRSNPFTFTLDRLDWAGNARRFETGTPPVLNAYAARAGIELLQSVGLRAVEARIGELVSRFHHEATERGFHVITPSSPAQRGPLVVLRLRNAAEIVDRLAARGIIASARGDGVRVSFHAYNNQSDVDSVLEALSSEGANG
jgi:selenocysteine lyase/cysteine desulfurase